MPKRYSADTRAYTKDDISAAVSVVKMRRLNIRQAALQYKIPRTTLDDHVKGNVHDKQPGRASTQSKADEEYLVNYMKYLAGQGFPMTRCIARQYIIAMVKRRNTDTQFNLEKGPSDKWFRKFVKRHPELAERKPETLDRSRGRMSNVTVVDQYFKLLQDTLKRLGIEDKPQQIFNCDETGWSGKEAASQNVFAVKGTQLPAVRPEYGPHHGTSLYMC